MNYRSKEEVLTELGLTESLFKDVAWWKIMMIHLIYHANREAFEKYEFLVELELNNKQIEEIIVSNYNKKGVV